MASLKEIAPAKKRGHEPAPPTLPGPSSQGICNGANPCKTCSDNGLQCVYVGDPGAPERLTLARAVKQIAALEAKLQIYEGHKAKTDYDYLSVSEGIPRIKDDVPTKAAADEDEDDDMANLLRGVNHLNLDAKVPEFYGGSSAHAIVEAVDTEDQEDEPGRPQPEKRFHAPELWKATNLDELTRAKVNETHLPPRALADRYNARFIQGTHFIIPLIDVETYLDRYEDFWNGKPTEGKGYLMWTAVMYMVIALGHQACTVDPDPNIRQQALHDNVGNQCFELAKYTFSNVPFAGGDMSAVNSMLFAFLWLYNQQRLHEAYAMLGSVFRVGYAIGLHREIMDANATAGEMNGWMSSWWSIVRYEIELSCLMGRPFGIQLKEVDLRQFPINVPGTQHQYLEYMRQFSYLALDAYEAVYSLANRRSSVVERANALSKSDRTLSAWYDRFKQEVSWVDKPHGRILHLTYLNMRILLYRVFLMLFVKQAKRPAPVKDQILNSAAKCVALSMSAIDTIASLPVGTNAVLQAAYHQVLGYLWNATVTLLLFGTDTVAPEKLGDRAASRQEISEMLVKAVDIFTAHQEGVAFFETAARITTKLFRRVVSDGLRRPSTTNQSDSPQTDFSSTPEIQDFFAGLTYYVDDSTNPSDFQGMFVYPPYSTDMVMAAPASVPTQQYDPHQYWGEYGPPDNTQNFAPTLLNITSTSTAGASSNTATSFDFASSLALNRRLPGSLQARKMATQAVKPRIALLAVDHPLNHTRTFKEKKPQSVEDKVTYLYERRQIEDLLNSYGYVLDTCMVDHSNADAWVDLFTDDCELTYPFGTHRTKDGLSEWCLAAETRFKRMTHLSSNFYIAFESDTVAYGRSTLQATCGLHETDLGQTFHEGGYYYWTFRKVNDEWKIAYLYLDVTWTAGESLGLNDGDHH
ncbi:hypothetical protein DV738_g4798, partial [Chaetothyriales sp. CBS 135597]